MSIIRIHRISEYANRLRSYEVFIDGAKVGEIKNGGTVDFTVSPGPHIVSLKIDWARSKEFSLSINEGDTKELQAASFPHAKWMMPVALALIIIHFILKSTLGIQWVFYLTIPFFLTLMYYITFGRNRYLVLKSDIN